jgi:hypothetical protein
VNARQVVLGLCLLPSVLMAQRLPSDDRKPPLTRKENWGMSLGIDLISAGFQPTKCTTLQTLPGGEVVRVADACGDLPQGYSSRGFGVGLNFGLVFLRYILFGAEVWTVGFSGTRDFTADNPPVSYHTETTNSLAASAYIGAITPPIGRGSKLGRRFWLGMLLGKSHWSGERQISSCETCRYDPLGMGRPGFLEPFVMFGGGDRDGGGGLRLAYRHHFGGFEAMHETVTFGLFFALGRVN